MNRISVLFAAGALSAVALTGCSSSASKSAGNGTPTLGSTSSAGSGASTPATTGSSGPGGSGGAGSASTSASSPAAGSSTGGSGGNGGQSNAAAPTSAAGSAHNGGACTTAEMPNGTWRGVAGSEGAGHVAADISLQNTSGHSCTISGFPGVSLLASNDHPLPTNVIKDDSVSVTTITVAPGAWVHSEIRYSADIPGPGEPESGQCEPTTVHALAQLPGDSAWTHITLDNPTPVCEKGEVQAKPFVGGKSSPTGG